MSSDADRPAMSSSLAGPFPAMEGELFEAVQASGILGDDGKSFPDFEPLDAPEAILAAYRKQRTAPAFDLKAFVRAHFAPPESPVPRAAVNPVSLPTVPDRIAALWECLRRPPIEPAAGSTLLPLSHPYIVPGGRFVELYYWDSYFTAEGLAASGLHDDVLNLARNFAGLIARYGFVPNGTRRYFLSRSQPPFFVFLLDLIARTHPDGFRAVAPMLGALRTEYDFWMDRGVGSDRVVSLADGRPANRYGDAAETPRPEAWRADLACASRLPEAERPALYRHIRAACESGWDFSSRWLAGADLATIRTTRIVPVDLNALLWFLESRLADWLGSGAEAQGYRDAADTRAGLFADPFWDDDAGFFLDHDLDRAGPSGVFSLAGVVPLFVGVATAAQADRVAGMLERRFLKPGGLVTTLADPPTGQQWDAPNGWAPLQWMAVQGLRRYGHDALADEVASRFCRLVESVYARTGRLMEKYDVVDTTREAGGGEYLNQDGFGWTNGVYLALLKSGRPSAEKAGGH